MHDSEILSRYLVDYGWAYRRSSPEEWVTGWQSEDRFYSLKLTYCDTVTSFRINPLLKLNMDWDSWPEFSKVLLEFNQQCKLVKLGIDDQGELIATIDLPTRGLNYSIFCETLGILGYYADFLSEELLNILDGIGYNYVRSLNLLT